MKLGLKKTHARDGSPAQTHQVSQSRSLLIFSARPGQARDGETWKTAAHVLRKKGLSRDQWEWVERSRSNEKPLKCLKKGPSVCDYSLDREL